MTKEHQNTIEDVKAAIDQAAALLAIMENSLAGTDGAPDPGQLADAAAGIERILNTASADLDKLAE